MAPQFVHLHVHSHYSLLDGCTPPELLPQLALALGQRAIALTDHGVLHGAVPFVRAAQEAGVKPILGCEVYVAPGSRFDRPARLREESAYTHLTLLAEDERGYENLCLLSSRGFLEGHHYRPRIDKDLLASHSDGLIALSGCLAAEIPALLRQGDFEQARRVASWYAEVFGRDRFFLELMDHGLEEQKRVNEGLLRIGKELGLSCVATNDVHYATAGEAQVQEVLLCVQTGKRLSDPDRLRLPSDQYYLKTAAEMERLFGAVEGALENTVAIAERCNVSFDFTRRHLPRFDGRGDARALLRSEVLAGARRRYGDPLPKEAAERIAHELEVISATGFSDYFLIVWDLVRFAKERGIPVGPGRGSAASSVVAYALGITDVDPLAYGLLFERFLNPERVTMPDIDIDFCFERRGEVLEYALERYGRDRVAQIGTFGTLAARAAIRDVGRVLGLPHALVDRVAKLVPSGPGVKLGEVVGQGALPPEMEREEVRNLVELALRVEGTPRHLSVHAAGIVIAPWPLEAKAPLCRTSDGTTVTQYPGEDLEALGFLKMDLLGLRTLTVLSKAVELVREHRGVELDLARLPLDDTAVYAALSRGEAEGVFQLETGMFQSLLKEVRPREFNDLVAILALGRPGPMARLDDYLRHRRGELKAAYPHPAMEGILEETHGIMLYQEQVMQVAVAVAGYTAGQADLLRRAMGKKLPEVMEQERSRFVAAASARGMDPEAASGLFDEVARFAEYGFAKSHSVAYALLAYQTAYLKVHHPLEFLAAQMNSVMGSSGRIARYLRECRRFGIHVYGPDVNKSRPGFSVEGGAIRFGLASVKNVGHALAEAICAERETGAFRSFDEFCERLAGPLLTKKALESLVRVGAFDGLGIGRADALARIEAAGRGDSLWSRRGQGSLFAGGEVGAEESVPKELPLAERLSDELELLGAYLTAHPLDPYREVFAPLTFAAAESRGEGEVAGVVVGLRESPARGGAMAFAQVEDGEGRIGEAVLFPRVYGRGGPLAPGSVVALRGRLEPEDESGVKMVVDSYFVVGEPMEIEVKSMDALRTLHASLRRSRRGTRPVVLVVNGEKAAARLALPPSYWAPGDEAGRPGKGLGRQEERR